MALVAGPAIGKPSTCFTDGSLAAPEWQWYWDSYIVSWPFAEGGGDVNSAGRSDLGGPRTGGASWVRSPFGAAMSFAGDDEYIELGTIPVGHPLQLDGIKFTASALMKHNGAGDLFQRIIDKSTAGDTADGWALLATWTAGSDGLLNVAVDNDGANPPANFRTDASAYTAGEWFHVVWQFGGDTSGDYHIYVNGVEVAASFVQGGANGFAPSVETNARIGTWNHAAARELDADLALLTFHRGIWTRAQVWQVFKDSFGPYRIDPRRMGFVAAVPGVPGGAYYQQYHSHVIAA